MARPSIKGTKKKRKKYKRMSVEYGHKNDVLKFIDEGHTPNEALDKFYGGLDGKERRAKQQQISKWRGNVKTIRAACDSGRSSHLNLRERGVGTVLSKEAEEDIVLWINSLRKDGAPVSRTMLKLKSSEVASECEIPKEHFSASSSWMKLFMQRHRLSLRTKTRQGQTTPEDAAEVAREFRAEVLRTIVEKNCVQVFNADQTAVCFEYVPKRTITTKGTKTVWIRCANKDKQRATVMLLGDSCGKKFDPFILFKTSPSQIVSRRADNELLRNGFGTTVWREVQKLQKKYPCKIFGNKTAWWNKELSLKFLEYHFASRGNRDDNILLLWDDFSAHWTQTVKDYAASLNVILLKVPPKYTYVCQRADIAWNKPFKGQLRALWVDRMREQLAAYKQGENERQKRKEEIEAEILCIQKTEDQPNATQKVAALRKKLDNEKFALVAPSRVDITQWIISCWSNLSKSTIIGGFAKAGLLTDTRVAVPYQDNHVDVDGLVAELEKQRVAEDEIASDDDIGTGDDIESDDEDSDDIGHGDEDN